MSNDNFPFCLRSGTFCISDFSNSWTKAGEIRFEVNFSHSATDSSATDVQDKSDDESFGWDFENLTYCLTENATLSPNSVVQKDYLAG